MAWCRHANIPSSRQHGTARHGHWAHGTTAISMPRLHLRGGQDARGSVIGCVWLGGLGLAWLPRAKFCSFGLMFSLQGQPQPSQPYCWGLTGVGRSILPFRHSQALFGPPGCSWHHGLAALLHDRSPSSRPRPLGHSQGLAWHYCRCALQHRAPCPGHHHPCRQVTPAPLHLLHATDAST
jgi:hypothetical protein